MCSLEDGAGVQTESLTVTLLKQQRCSLEDEVDVQLGGQAVDGQVLTVQTHVGEQVQLVPKKLCKYSQRLKHPEALQEKNPKDTSSPAHSLLCLHRSCTLSAPGIFLPTPQSS